MQNAETTTEELATPIELAKELKVTPPTVMAWFRQGIIPAEVAVGRIYRFDREKCKAALASQAVKNGGGR